MKRKNIMASKALILSFFLIFSSSLVHQGLCGPLEGLLKGVTVVKERNCIAKMKYCHASITTGGLIKPSGECCDRVIKMVTTDTECYCKYYDNERLRKAMGLSKDDVAKLPGACGASVDPSKCNNGTSIATAPVSPRSSAKMITPYGIIHFGVPGFVALLTALVFSIC